MVKIAVSVLFAAAFASSVLAQDFTPSTVDEIIARDVASLSGAEQDLFSRAAVKVMNELFSREDLSEMVGREVDELSQRDLEDLLEREFDLNEISLDVAARELTSYIDDDLVARADKKEEGAPAGSAPAGNAPAGTPPAGQTPPPQEPKPQHTVWGRFCSWFRGIFLGGNKPKKADAAKTKAKSAPEAKKPADKKPAAAAPEKADAPAKEEGAEKAEGAAPEGENAAPAAEEARELLEEPFERSFGEEDLEEFAARFYENEAFEARDYEDFEEVFEREPEFEDDMFEREPEFEGDFYERDFADVWDEELLTRAFDVLEQLDQLD
ncbi:hypothetical protein EST38_g6289 [Candolleomyces aberdarensis]|uniref:Uncharacterized protein n=1 Tax=Candolleomyces aberdarensis TaxID=2316362 RepID=A0A4Q2DKZ7_9AGAR|nr:hypothetical protein EST38_g6289 [Candolleomyces aberdarensis]